LAFAVVVFRVRGKPAPLALPGNFVQGVRLNCCIWTGLSDAQICLRRCSSFADAKLQKIFEGCNLNPQITLGFYIF
ncbi:MAG: hypothetical protein IJQ48_07245, partial [Prevotella sp.]|nr:hypothetical protein [Prevotella sp.]